MGWGLCLAFRRVYVVLIHQQFDLALCLKQLPQSFRLSDNQPHRHKDEAVAIGVARLSRYKGRCLRIGRAGPADLGGPSGFRAESRRALIRPV